MRSRLKARSIACSRGFTFAELLAAMVFIGIVIPVATQGLLIANRAGVMAERRRAAVELADRQLSERIVTGDWRDAQTESDFGEQWPGFRWEMTRETWGQETMQLVSVEVFYTVQGQQSSVRLSTIVDNADETQTAGGTIAALGMN